MIETQIICCHPCSIPDLGNMILQRGEIRWVSDKAALASSDLRKEQAKGNIRVSRKIRKTGEAPTHRRPAPPFVAQSRPQNQGRSILDHEPESKVVETVIRETVVQEVDTNKLKAELLGDLLPNLRSVIAEEMGKISQKEISPTASLDPNLLEKTLESVLRKVGVPSAGISSSRPSLPNEPLFIPENLVPKDVKAKIETTQKESSAGEDFDETQSALRALKRQRRGKNVKEEDEP